MAAVVIIAAAAVVILFDGDNDKSPCVEQPANPTIKPGYDYGDYFEFTSTSYNADGTINNTVLIFGLQAQESMGGSDRSVRVYGERYGEQTNWGDRSWFLSRLYSGDDLTRDYSQYEIIGTKVLDTPFGKVTCNIYDAYSTKYYLDDVNKVMYKSVKTYDDGSMVVVELSGTNVLVITDDTPVVGSTANPKVKSGYDEGDFFEFTGKNVRADGTVSSEGIVFGVLAKESLGSDRSLRVYGAWYGESTDWGSHGWFLNRLYYGDYVYKDFSKYEVIATEEIDTAFGKVTCSVYDAYSTKYYVDDVNKVMYKSVKTYDDGSQLIVELSATNLLVTA